MLNSFNALGRRLLRDLLAPEKLLAKPSADLSAVEYEILMHASNGPIDFCTLNPQYVELELLPSVHTFLPRASRPNGRQLQLFSQSSDLAVSADHFASLGKILQQALDAYRLASPHDNQRYARGYRPGKKSRKNGT